MQRAIGRVIRFQRSVISRGLFLALVAATARASNIPAGYVLDTLNPFYTSLAAAWAMNEGSGSITTDARNSIACTATGSSAPVWATDGTEGKILTFTSGTWSNSYLNCGKPVAVQDIGYPIGSNAASMCFRANSAYGQYNVADRSDNNSVEYGWTIRAGSGATNFTHEYSAQNVYSFVYTYGLTAGTYHTLCVTYDGSQGPSGIIWYLDGSVLSSSGTFTGSGAAGSDSAYNLYLGASQWNGSLDGSLSWFYIWNGRVLSATEVSSLTSNPGQLFKAGRRRVIVILSSVCEALEYLDGDDPLRPLLLEARSSAQRVAWKASGLLNYTTRNGIGPVRASLDYLIPQ